MEKRFSRKILDISQLLYFVPNAQHIGSHQVGDTNQGCVGPVKNQTELNGLLDGKNWLWY